MTDCARARGHGGGTARTRASSFDKPSLDAPNDSIIALCMALETLESQPEPVQVVG